jgi:protein SCO1/2
MSAGEKQDSYRMTFSHVLASFGKPMITAALLFACNSNTPKTEALPYYASADFTPHWIDSNSSAIDSIPQIAPFTLFNQNGDTITEKNFAGKIYVADFIFTSCGGICPNMTGNMRKVQEAFKDDDNVLLLSHSVTPELDSVAVLKNYAALNGVSNGKWHVVTGDRKMIYDLARHSYFADEDLGRPRDENEFLHTENFFLIDRQQRIRGVYNGVMPTEITRLIEDILTLKIESEQKPSGRFCARMMVVFTTSLLKSRSVRTVT